jgi:SAM-dependent methyltransferase
MARLILMKVGGVNNVRVRRAGAFPRHFQRASAARFEFFGEAAFNAIAPGRELEGGDALRNASRVREEKEADRMNEAKLHDFLGRVVGDIGATLSAALVVIGDKLGLYKAMAGAGPLTPADLARRTGTHERYIREWLLNQAAGGFVEYDAAGGTFTLPPEHAHALADESSPVYLLGAFQVVTAVLRDEPKIREAFRTGAGVDWGDHDPGLFEGTKRFFAPSYRAHLVDSWLPALDGVVDRLQRGAKAADVGCGFGASTIIMAQAYPRSTFTGIDYHAPSIEAARKAAAEANLGGRVRFETRLATDFDGGPYDFIACFDCLHDMGDPAAVARNARRNLASHGAWMIVEPFAGDRVEDNLTPVGRVYSAASTLICTPASLAQEGRVALGAQAGEAKLREQVLRGGFTRFRRATQTPFNLVFEAKP